METVKKEVDVCAHCGQELQKASKERREIKDMQLENIAKVSTALNERQDKMDVALTERQEKLDEATENMLEIIRRIERKVGADARTLEDIRELEAKVKARATVQERRQEMSDAQDKEDESNG